MKYENNPRLLPDPALTKILDDAADIFSTNQLGKTYEFYFYMQFDNREGVEILNFDLRINHHGENSTCTRTAYRYPANPIRNRIADWANLPDIPDEDCFMYSQEQVDIRTGWFISEFVSRGILFSEEIKNKKGDHNQEEGTGN